MALVDGALNTDGLVKTSDCGTRTAGLLSCGKQPSPGILKQDPQQLQQPAPPFVFYRILNRSVGHYGSMGPSAMTSSGYTQFLKSRRA